jgi:non-specific serine/threonine protein kinase/serine/threonine-protein kinase
MERDNRVKELFQETMDMDPQTRGAFLSAACAGDLSLQAEVEQLISLKGETTESIEEPALHPHDNASDTPGPAGGEGRIIGHYRIIREIGHGGMGAVYLAVRADDQYDKRVAIKLIKGGLHSDYIRRRFLSERQILASLNHPNIAKLLDGGTTQAGNPYLVMDYIEGLPIRQYCEQNGLSTGERLKLFRTVCSAVHYAHQNLIIHRDLKPGNILVSADGTPHLLDFGIAKLLNPELSDQTLDLTVGAMGPMTPEYASPEQVRGEPLTTSSDVYSLGVLLYELLTGHRPYLIKSRILSDIALIICEQEPERPSTVVKRTQTSAHSDAETLPMASPESAGKSREDHPEKLRRRLQGDLDNIVLMAMRKEAARRYASVEQFSEDIRRHLEGLPCIARKATLSYRAAKFIGRNKVAVTAALLMALTLFAGVVATLWQARIASLQRAKAEQRFNDVRQLANSFMFEIHDEIENLPGSTPARQLLVNQALQYLDNLAQESSDDAALRGELATAYAKVGDIQGNPMVANLGDLSGALESYRKALKIRESLPNQPAKTLDAEIELANNFDRVGDMLVLDHDLNGATENYQQALEIRERLAQKEPDNHLLRFDLSLSYANIGDVFAEAGDIKGSLENYHRSLSIREALLAQEPTNAKYRRSIAAAYQRLATSKYRAGDRSGAVEFSRKSLAMFEPLAKEAPQNSKASRELAFAYNSLGDFLWYNDDLKGATENYRIGLLMREELLKADPTNVQARRDVAISYGNYGYTLAQMGNEEGLELYRKNVEIMESMLAANPDHANSLRDMATTYSFCGDVYGFIAARKNLPVAKRIAYYQLAKSFNERSIKILEEMRARGVLKSNESDSIGKIARNIADYETAIEKLRK